MLRAARTFAMLLLLLGIQACGRPGVSQSVLKNDAARNHSFLTDMYADGYYPEHLVDKCRNILIDLCHAVEVEQPKTVNALYSITHYATQRFNELQEEFEREGSELETVAREAIAMEFVFIADTYGFETDLEEMIAPREW
jgi:hypothetical protein